MSNAAQIDAALAWADRIEKGEGDSYDPYIVALAQLVRQQRGQLATFQALLGAEDERPADWQEILAEFQQARDRVAELEKAMLPFALNMVVRSLGYVVFNNERYELVPERVAKAAEAATERVRVLLAAE